MSDVLDVSYVLLSDVSVSDVCDLSDVADGSVLFMMLLVCINALDCMMFLISDVF